jgi:hypothetical protein
MTSDRKPRIDLDPLTHRLLIAEATKRGMRPKALLTKLIEEAASPEAKALVGIVERGEVNVQGPQIAGPTTSSDSKRAGGKDEEKIETRK